MQHWKMRHQNAGVENAGPSSTESQPTTHVLYNNCCETLPGKADYLPNKNAPTLYTHAQFDVYTRMENC